AYGASNSFLPEWTYCYFLNNSSNVLLGKLDATTFSGDATTKKNLLKAWAYWWKGYAYCRLGSMYLAGVITSTPNSTNGNFVDHDAMVTEGLKDLDTATTLLGGLASGGDYDATLSQIMPNMMQVPHLPSPTEWKRNIATFAARTVLVNKRLKDMTAADYAAVLNYVNAGVQASDYVFGIRTNADNSISVFDKDFGSMLGNLAGEGNTYFVSERSVQDFKSGDKRLANNFASLSSTIINKRGRGITFGTRWQLVSGGNGNGAFVYFDQTYGADNFYIGGTYEENLLMKAECLIQTSQIDQGLAIIDQVRTLQGAGLPAVSGTGLSLAQALDELRKERRCALLYRGVAFYDLRRWGYTDDVSKGGGRTGCVVLDGSGNVNTNATINYSYMSYWDVPQNELDFNSSTNKTTVLKNPS
ncbi:MAG TPA: RagB/SusD family nutrient uptake outer membrane protein, partial [Puia sp.]